MDRLSQIKADLKKVEQINDKLKSIKTDDLEQKEKIRIEVSYNKVFIQECKYKISAIEAFAAHKKAGA